MYKGYVKVGYVLFSVTFIHVLDLQVKNLYCNKSFSLIFFGYPDQNMNLNNK